MGCFDTVLFEMKCPVCGEQVKNFQSKDGRCAGDELLIGDVDNFYGDCSLCGSWFEFTRQKNVEANRVVGIVEAIHLGFKLEMYKK